MAILSISHYHRSEARVFRQLWTQTGCCFIRSRLLLPGSAGDERWSFECTASSTTSAILRSIKNEAVFADIDIVRISLAVHESAWQP